MKENQVTDKTPLLVDEENDFENEVVRKRYFVDDTTLVNTNSPIDDDDLIAIFVISFDTRSGNVVEWCYPQNADMNGIEFKAIISGAHKIKTDFIYFKQNQYYGLSCFENMPVQSDIERGARMKSVGILSHSYSKLAKHIKFLQMQVRKLLEAPGNYDQLKLYFEQSKNKVVFNLLPVHDLSAVDSSNDIKYDNTDRMENFSHFTEFFGVNIFVLWKLVLLRKRILFFSSPPIGLECHKVFCTTSMGTHLMPWLTYDIVQPLFNVNLNDVNNLEKKSSFVACTTEKVYELKNSLYDAYVCNETIKIKDERLKDIVQVTSTDQKNFKLLKNMSENVGLAFESADKSFRSHFLRFFAELNEKLLETLHEVSQTDDKQLSTDVIKEMGFNPSSDKKFLIELIELYNLDVVYVIPNLCCPMCHLW